MISLGLPNQKVQVKIVVKGNVRHSDEEIDHKQIVPGSIDKEESIYEKKITFNRSDHNDPGNGIFV